MTDLSPVDAMTTDYRAMCAELAEELVNEYSYCTEWEKGLPLRESNRDASGVVSELLTRARALLAQPVAEGPTDEELTLTYVYAVAAAVGNKRGPYTTEDAEAAQLAGLRAVHAKWGTLTPQPPSPISDATLNQWICDHLRYTAREGGDSLRAAALDACLAAGFDPFHHPAPQ